MTDRQALHQLIEALPDSQLVAAEKFLTSLQEDEEARQDLRVLARLAGERPLYDTDFYTWTQQQALAFRDRDWPTLDIEHLAEEVDDLGSSVQHAIESHLERLLLHLLKWRYDPAQEPRRGWRLTIRHARRELAKYLRRNPGLQHHPASYLAEAYDAIREDVAIDTDLPLATFPEVCPWSITQVLDTDFWPDGSA